MKFSETKLAGWLNNHPAINISEIAKGMGISRASYLHEIIKDQRMLSERYAFAIAKELSKYGLQLNGWIFEPYDEEYPLTLFALSWKNEEVEEIDNENHFTYKREYYQRAFERDAFFLFIKNSK